MWWRRRRAHLQERLQSVRVERGVAPHTVSRPPSLPVMVSARTAPGLSPLIATGMKCSVRPCVGALDQDLPGMAELRSQPPLQRGLAGRAQPLGALA